MTSIFIFLGNEYSVSGRVRLSDLCSMYLFHKALEGDALAKELLDAAQIKVTDKNGKQIYPPVEMGSV